MAETATFHYDVDARSVGFVIDEELYSLDAIYGAAYLFVDRCWLFLDRPADKQVQVRLRSKEAEPAGGTLDALAGEFANELLNQVLRLRIGDSTRSLREYTLARAFFGDDDGERPNIDDLLAELDAEELADDPLEIQVPWDTGS
ncbi:MAG: His-Xaa-Ser system protein HxsD [Proteobacteria bacterium]|nr:His-Xaa-Ser system protein HxsD [Pseudomonadota bacterium]